MVFEYSEKAWAGSSEKDLTIDRHMQFGLSSALSGSDTVLR